MYMYLMRCLVSILHSFYSCRHVYCVFIHGFWVLDGFTTFDLQYILCNHLGILHNLYLYREQ